MSTRWRRGGSKTQRAPSLRSRRSLNSLVWASCWWQGRCSAGNSFGLGTLKFFTGKGTEFKLHRCSFIYFDYQAGSAVADL